MKLVLRNLRNLRFLIAFTLLAWLPWSARGQSCQTSGELDPATRTAIITSAQKYFEMAARGDTASLRQNAIPSLASDFTGIESTVKDNQPNLAGAPGAVQTSFVLDASGSAATPNAEFYCGVFGRNGQTATSAAFYLNNLPPGKYAIVLMDAKSTKGRTMFSQVLEQTQGGWKLAGLYIKPAQISGHDSDWFLAQARQYKTKGQLHNAFFYYEEARSLISPLPFMSTLATDKLFDESQNLQPTDMPLGGKTADLSAASTTYKLTAVFPQMVGNDLDLIVKYQSADVANTNLAYQSNVNVMKALVAKYPELRDAFVAVVARAVSATGQDYGTLLAIKDIK